MKTSFYALILILILSLGCNSDTQSDRGEDYAQSGLNGGLFRIGLTDDIRSIFPHNVVDAAAFNLMNQVYEGLFELDLETKEFVPSLTESYEISADGRTYTFHLRKGIYFHDDEVFENGKGREVKAADVVYCFTRLCEPSPNNSLYPFVIDIIKGAADHYKKVEEGLDVSGPPSGLRLLNDYSFEIELEHPTPNFLAILTHPCCWIFPKELYAYGDEINNWCIGTGPFKARIVKMNEVIILEKNNRYWKTDDEKQGLPYLSAVRCNFMENEKEQLEAFLDGHLDLIFSVPLSRIANLEERKGNQEENGFDILTFPGMRIEYYGFQHRSDLFDDKRLRKAINLAIDRQFLVDSVLKGYGDVANRGFVPPSMPGYEAEKIEGFAYDPAEASKLLREAGYPGGKDFPVLTIQINDGNPKALAVAERVQKMLMQNLNLTIELSVLPRNKHYDEIEKGKVDIWRDGWIADYPDPENFLKLFHGKLVPEDSVKASYLNTVRFKNEDFDRFFESSMREPDRKERSNLLLQADRVVIEEAAVAPLYYERWIWLVSDRVQNLNVSPMGELDLSRVYLGKNKEPESGSEL